ncbi:MAG: hypothetical protein L3K17_10085 [Thermoplasmata archaeon]|nr:hypothetical protein [Thermoplasmata archaeon]
MPKQLTRLRGWPGPEYHATVVFRAPLAFAYDWCTDFQESDPKLEAEEYRRRVLRRTSSQVVYEDLEERNDGWHWARYDVRLAPPNRWRMNSIGNYRSVRAEYRLTRLADERTRFDLWLKRESGPLEGARLTKSQRERTLTTLWRRFGKALESDYAKARPRRKRARR